jgi:hypothetical protein
VAGRERLLDEHVDRVAVLGVNHHERAGLRRHLHRPEERLIVDHQRALVGHEELVGGDPLVGQRRELLERAALLEIGDGHVVAHVDHLLAARLAAPLLERLAERRSSRLDHEVDVGGRAAEGGRGLSRLDVVDRNRAAERHVEMRVGVDAAWEHVLTTRVDHPVRLLVQRLADQADRLVVDVEICDVVVRGGDDPAAFDQDRHRCEFKLVPCRCHRAARSPSFASCRS